MLFYLCSALMACFIYLKYSNQSGRTSTATTAIQFCSEYRLTISISAYPFTVLFVIQLRLAVSSEMMYWCSLSSNSNLYATIQFSENVVVLNHLSTNYDHVLSTLDVERRAIIQFTKRFFEVYKPSEYLQHQTFAWSDFQDENSVSFGSWVIFTVAH